MAEEKQPIKREPGYSKDPANQGTKSDAQNKVEDTSVNRNLAPNVEDETDEQKAEREEAEAKAAEEAKAKAERDERRKKLVEDIATSDEGYVVRNEGNAEAVDEAFADGYVTPSNVQRGIEVEEQYFLTEKGFSSRGN